ncbi:hypothetical protein JTB14_016676 [Gonioctena quinquepunctata]|nr:hypothetical protein JTB14_016676 [Gonioctena quinquepunctata]
MNKNPQNESSKQNKKKIVNLQLLHNPPQTYVGESLENNLHGYGFYLIEKENEKVFYDGLFYANKLEGYCQIFYQDGSNFQGLFRNNQRFGPGVFTYPTGEQDVGLWDGFSIVRLGTSIHSVVVPKLAVTIEGNVKTLKYRNLVPVCFKTKTNKAQNILERLTNNETILRRAPELYNPDVRNRNNMFFNNKIYDDNFFENQDCCIDILDEKGKQVKRSSRMVEDNKDELISAKIEKLSAHIEMLGSLLAKNESKKVAVLDKLTYCRTCCYTSNTFEIIDIKVPEKEQEISVDDEKSSVSSTYFYDMSGLTSESVSINTSEKNRIKEENVENICICEEDIQVEDITKLEKQYDFLVEEETFYGNISKNMMEKLNILSESLEKRSKMKTKKIVVDELLAWNNEKLLTDMLKHSFLHRESERLVTFKVSEILGGQRTATLYIGYHETSCRNFLVECNSGEVSKVIEYLRKHNVNVNVTDASGNSGLFYAVAKYRSDVIRMLVNFGANLDQMNDEGLTPLNLSILCYLAQKNDIDDWEACFLSPTITLPNEQTDVMKWHMSKALFTLNNLKENRDRREKKITGEKLKSDSSKFKGKQYVFDTSFRECQIDEKAESQKSEKSPFCMRPSIFVDPGGEYAENTISTLLECGADPNVGEAPLPPLIMSMFSENMNIVLKLLEAGADIHVVTPDENLTCLHLIASSPCSLENVMICNQLSQYLCDPNASANANHWPEQKTRILGDVCNPEDMEDDKKNPLHLLCLRQDFETDNCNFFQEVCNILIGSSINIRATYLGQNALCLAILSGNKKLSQTLLASGLMNPYEIFDYNIGNVLTLFVSDRFKNILPINRCIGILEFLVELGVNPLHPIGKFENVIEFIDRKSNGMKNVNDKQARTTGKDGNDTQITLKKNLRNLTRKIILEKIEMDAVENLYNLTELNWLDRECIKVLAEYLTPEKTINNLKLLLKNNKMESERLDKGLCLNLLEYVERNKRKVQRMKKKQTVEFEIEQSMIDAWKTAINLIGSEEVGDRSTETELLALKLNDSLNYNVCFQCLQGRDKILVSCSRCQLIQFCSENCNKLNLKQKQNQHACGLNVFAEKERIPSGITINTKDEDGDLRELCKLARHEVEQIMFLKKQEALEELKRKEEKQRKLDVYGTRYIREKNLSRIDSLKSQGISLSFPVSMITLRKSFGKESRSLSMQLDGKLQRLSTLERKYSISSYTPKKPEEKFKTKHKKTQTRGISKKKDEVLLSTPECESRVSDNNLKGKISLPIVSKFEPLPNLEEPYLITKTTRKIPHKPQFFMDILGKYFPKADLSYLLLPYICYSDGQLYYQFLGEEYYSKNYSTI